MAVMMFLLLWKTARNYPGWQNIYKCKEVIWQKYLLLPSLMVLCFFFHGFDWRAILFLCLQGAVCSSFRYFVRVLMQIDVISLSPIILDALLFCDQSTHQIGKARRLCWHLSNEDDLLLDKFRDEVWASTTTRMTLRDKLNGQLCVLVSNFLALWDSSENEYINSISQAGGNFGERI